MTEQVRRRKDFRLRFLEHQNTFLMPELNKKYPYGEKHKIQKLINSNIIIIDKLKEELK